MFTVHLWCSVSVIHYFTGREYSILWTYHILFVHSSVGRHLGCFHFLTSMNLLLYTILYKFLGGPMFSVLSARNLAVEFLGHRLMKFSFWRNRETGFPSGRTILHLHQQCPKAPISPPPPSHHFLLSILLVPGSSWWKGVSHCGVDLRLPNDWCRWATFHVLIQHLHVFFGETPIQIFCPFLSWVTFPSIFELWELFDVFWCYPLIRPMICKYSLPLCGFFFSFSCGCPLSHEFLILLKSNWPIFFFACLCFWCHLWETIA